MNRFAVCFASCITLVLIFCERSFAEVKIGVVLPLTGEFAFVGQTFLRGMTSAAKEVGRELIIEDDGGFDPRRALDAVRKLISIDKVSLIVLTSHDLTAAVEPLLTQARVPALILWDNSLELRKDHPYVFAMGYLPEQAGDTLAAFAAHCLGIESVAMVASEAKWSERFALGFTQRASIEGLSIVYNQAFPLGTNDFRSSLAKLMTFDPSAVVVPLYGQSLVAFVRQARELGFRGDILTGELLFYAELQALGGLAEKIYLTNAWIEDPPDNADSKTIPDAARLTLASDAVNFVDRIADAFESRQGSNADILTVLRDTAFDGITGRIDFKGDNISPRYQPVVQVGQGGFRRARCDDFHADFHLPAQ